LERLHDALQPYLQDRTLAARVFYWQGFAMWGSFLNGANDAVDQRELAAILDRAVIEFDSAIANDSALVDAKTAEAACLMSMMNMRRNDTAQVHALVPRFVRLLSEVQRVSPTNPRFLWVRGAGLLFSPASRGGPDSAIAAYERGLDAFRQRTLATGGNGLDPTWGEPELLMSLAWANLHRATPDLAAADQYALDALALEPSWHYVRDILLPQIRRAIEERRSSQ
jgi:hypothetical protein